MKQPYEIRRYRVPDGEYDMIPEEDQEVVDLYLASRGPEDVYDISRERNATLDCMSETTVVTLHDEDDALLGVAAVDLDRDNISAWLDGIAIDPEARGLGIGKYLMEHLVQLSREAGKTSLRGHAIESATGFYDNLGFYQDGEATSTRLSPYRTDIT